MTTTRPHYELSLAARGLFEIPDISGVQVVCRRGALWITLDHDPRDIVLEAGETFFSTEHRRAIVFAFEASTLALRPGIEHARAGRAPSISFVAPRAVA